MIMDNEAKQVLSETGSLLEKGEFDKVVSVCEVFLTDHPQNLKIWWNYILADCGVKNEKELIENGIDLKDNEIYKKAISVLADNKREQLITKEKSISRRKAEDSFEDDTSDLKTYFHRRIADVKNRLELERSEIKSILEVNKNVFTSVNKNAANLYGNSLFGFLLITVFFSVPFLFLSVILKLYDLNVAIVILPLAAYGIIILIRVIIRLIKHKGFISEYSTYQNDCIFTEEQLSDKKETIRKLTYGFNKMRRIYREYSKTKNLSYNREIVFKKKFDAYYIKTK